MDANFQFSIMTSGKRRLERSMQKFGVDLRDSVHHSLVEVAVQDSWFFAFPEERYDALITDSCHLRTTVIAQMRIQ